MTRGKWKKKWHHGLKMRFNFVWNGASEDNGTPKVPVTGTESKEGMCFHKSLKHLVGAAGWFVYIKNQSDRRHICKVGLQQVRKAILRTAFRKVFTYYYSQCVSLSLKSNTLKQSPTANCAANLHPLTTSLWIKTVNSDHVRLSSCSTCSSGTNFEFKLVWQKCYF